MTLFEIKNLVVKTPEKEILKGISLSIEAGSHLTITGPSGSGKSSLLKVLASLQPYDSGTISYQSENLLALNPIAYRQEVSYCFQQPSLFGESVRDNLSFPYEVRKQPFDEAQAIAALAKVNLDSSFLDQKISELSGGEKQRVALVRNLLFAPKVLLLDEITTGLDEANKTVVRDLIKTVQATIIEVTHDKDEIAAATSFIQIVEGELVSNE